jgi:hypothetical protein
MATCPRWQCRIGVYVCGIVGHRWRVGHEHDRSESMHWYCSTCHDGDVLDRGETPDSGRWLLDPETWQRWLDRLRYTHCPHRWRDVEPRTDIVGVKFVMRKRCSWCWLAVDEWREVAV